MFFFLAIISAILVVIPAYFLQKYGKEKFNYSILSVGGLGVSSLGTVAFAFSCYYYKNHNIPEMVVAIIVGCIPYIMMLIRDCKKMNITLAIASGLLRFLISVLLIMAILCFLMKGTSKDKG